MSTLGDVLDFAGVPERIDRPANERYVTLKVRGNGAVERTIKNGKVPVPFTGYRIKRGQFIYSRIDARNGAYAIVPERLHGAVVSKDFPVFAIRTDRVEPAYLLHFMRAGSLQRQVRAASFGATNRQRITEDVFLGFEFPLPPLPEQRRTAAILDQADTLRAKRRQVLAHLDTLTQSIFHDMFGNPDDSTDTVPFAEVAVLSGGRNLVAEDSSAESEYRVLKISAVTTGQFIAAESKPLPTDYVPPTADLVSPGDLLMSRANTTELVGAVALVHETPPNLALPDKIWRFSWLDEHSVPLFYHALFGTASVRRRISRLSSGTGGSMKNISKAKLASLSLPRVGPEKQREFAARVEGVLNQRSFAQRAHTAENELFCSLQSLAFRGEL